MRFSSDLWSLDTLRIQGETHLLESFVIYKSGSILGHLELPLLNGFAEFPDLSFSLCVLFVQSKIDNPHGEALEPLDCSRPAISKCRVKEYQAKVVPRLNQDLLPFIYSRRYQPGCCLLHTRAHANTHTWWERNRGKYVELGRESHDHSLVDVS